MPDIKVLNLPFDEAIQYFRRKVRLPTRIWKDLWRGMHARAFVVAGAMKSELLSDLFKAVEKGIADGMTISQFRKDFDTLVAKHGWKYKGGRGWRTGVIFNTNMRTAHAAGHYKQMMDPDVLKARPFLRYVASSSREPRAEHEQWYNLILPADDPFWETHRPPNGWGCKCGVVNHSAREVERLKKEESDGLHPVKTNAPEIEHYKWKDKATGKTHKIPTGIDPGWDYNVGEAAWGKRLSDDAMSAWRAQGAKAYERLTPGSWETYGRSRKIPADTPRATPGKKLKGIPAATAALKKILGGDEKVFSFEKEGFRYDVLVNAGTLAGHMDLTRSPFLPFITEAMEDPYEVWLSFEKHKGTGKVLLRQRIIKAIKLDKDRELLVVAQSKNGIMEAWTMMQTTDFKYINRQREGKLMWAR